MISSPILPAEMLELRAFDTHGCSNSAKADRSEMPSNAINRRLMKGPRNEISGSSSCDPRKTIHDGYCKGK